MRDLQKSVLTYEEWELITQSFEELRSETIAARMISCECAIARVPLWIVDFEKD